MAASQGMCCHVLSQPGQSIPGLALQWELGTAWGHRGDLGLMRGTTAGPDSASPLLALPFSCGVWAGIPGRSRAGPMQPWPALPCCCHIDQLNGELMAGTPLGSAAPIRKAELGAPGHCPSGCCKYHFCSSSCGCPAAAAGRVCAAHECVLGSRVCGHSALCVCVCVCAGSAMESSIICWAQPVTAAHTRHPGCLLWVICESSPRPCLPVPTLLVPTLPVLTLPVPMLPVPTLTVPMLPVPAAQGSAESTSLRVQSSQLAPARGKGVTLPPLMCLLGPAGGSRAKWLVPVWARCPEPASAAMPSEACRAQQGREGNGGCAASSQPALPGAEAQHTGPCCPVELCPKTRSGWNWMGMGVPAWGRSCWGWDPLKVAPLCAPQLGWVGAASLGCGTGGDAEGDAQRGSTGASGDSALLPPRAAPAADALSRSPGT